MIDGDDNPLNAGIKPQFEAVLITNMSIDVHIIMAYKPNGVYLLVTVK